MKMHPLLLAMILASTTSAFAASPSSVLAQTDELPGAYEFFGYDGEDVKGNDRDEGWHTGWCKAPGHPESQGKSDNAQANGHRNHDHCEGGPM